MIYLRLLVTIALPLLLGLGVVALIYRKATISFLERIALAWGIGLGVLGMGMFVLSLVGVQLTLVSACLPALAAALGLAGYAVIRKYPLFDLNSALRTIKSLGRVFSQPNKLTAVAEKLLTILIILVVAFVFFDALVKPIVNFDDLWRQGCIAKIIFTTGKVLTEQSMELAGHHPYLNPLAQAWVYIGIGSWNDALGKIVFSLCFTSLIFIFYFGIRRYANRLYSLLFTYLLTSFPLIVFHAGTAYSDLMQTFYYTTGIIYLYHWLKSKETGALSISALFLGIGIFVKQLGTPLWIIAAFVLFLYIIFESKRQFMPLIHFILLSSVISLAWLMNKNSFLFNYLVIKLLPQVSQPDVIKAITKTTYGLPTLSGILFHLGKRMYTYADWQILWFVFPAAIVLRWRQFWQSQLKYLGLIVLLNLLMMIYGFTEQNAYNYLIDGTLVQRMMMYQIPVVLFIMAKLIYDVLNEKCG